MTLCYLERKHKMNSCSIQGFIMGSLRPSGLPDRLSMYSSIGISDAAFASLIVQAPALDVQVSKRAIRAALQRRENLLAHSFSSSACLTIQLSRYARTSTIMPFRSKRTHHA